jgi:hypothetical protein
VDWKHLWSLRQSAVLAAAGFPPQSWRPRPRVHTPYLTPRPCLLAELKACVRFVHALVASALGMGAKGSKSGAAERLGFEDKRKSRFRKAQADASAAAVADAQGTSYLLRGHGACSDTASWWTLHCIITHAPKDRPCML